jgi:hypothetical protein
VTDKEPTNPATPPPREPAPPPTEPPPPAPDIRNDDKYIITVLGEEDRSKRPSHTFDEDDKK